MTRPLRICLLLGATLAATLAPARAIDPPHAFSTLPDDPCASCHTPHTSPGGALTTVAGNANLCISCHNPGGPAAALPFAPADQALPAPGLPAAATPAGDSHRWDSGASGRVSVVAGNTSPGTVQTAGAFTGRYAKTYTLTIDTSGDQGVATFSWSATTPGGGSGSDTTGTGVALDEGLTATFADGASSPSFVAGDQWRVYVRTDLTDPTEPKMLARLEDGKAMCSTCHDEHSQRRTPFDPSAPAYGGSGTGAGRHFQRLDNDADQMCTDCHSPRDVTQPSLGSHPVGVGIPAGEYRSPPTLPLDTNSEVACLSCHQPHYAATDDGTLARLADQVALCGECHTLAGAGASHLDGTTGVLWPGGQYGSNFPQVTDSGKTGFCTNCHQPHGWPDDDIPAQDYSLLLVDEEQSLCYTCHDGSPVGPSIRSEFQKSSAHPLGLADGIHTPAEPVLVDSPNRHVECADCHNPHQALPRVDLPGPATSPRPASGPLTGVSGITTAGTAVDPAAFEYQVCFRCHADSTGTPAAPTNRQFPQTNLRLAFAASQTSFHAVAVTGTTNPNVPSLLTGWSSNSVLACTSCHNNNSGQASGGSGPNGAHGSTWPSLLERRYETADNTTYTAAKYALCFKCHDSGVIFDKDVSFKEHDKHINGEDTPCNVCHDAHGSAGQKFLINFDTSVAFPADDQGNETPRLEFIAPEDSANGKGACYVLCHGKDHYPKDYDPNY